MVLLGWDLVYRLVGDETKLNGIIKGGNRAVGYSVVFFCTHRVLQPLTQISAIREDPDETVLWSHGLRPVYRSVTRVIWPRYIRPLGRSYWKNSTLRAIALHKLDSIGGLNPSALARDASRIGEAAIRLVSSKARRVCRRSVIFLDRRAPKLTAFCRPRLRQLVSRAGPLVGSARVALVRLARRLVVVLENAQPEDSLRLPRELYRTLVPLLQSLPGRVAEAAGAAVKIAVPFCVDVCVDVCVDAAASIPFLVKIASVIAREFIRASVEIGQDVVAGVRALGRVIIAVHQDVWTMWRLLKQYALIPRKSLLQIPHFPGRQILEIFDLCYSLSLLMNSSIYFYASKTYYTFVEFGQAFVEFCQSLPQICRQGLTTFLQGIGQGLTAVVQSILEQLPPRVVGPLLHMWALRPEKAELTSMVDLLKTWLKSCLKTCIYSLKELIPLIRPLFDMCGRIIFAAISSIISHVFGGLLGPPTGMIAPLKGAPYRAVVATPEYIFVNLDWCHGQARYTRCAVQSAVKTVIDLAMRPPRAVFGAGRIVFRFVQPGAIAASRMVVGAAGSVCGAVCSRVLSPIGEGCIRCVTPAADLAAYTLRYGGPKGWRRRANARIKSLFARCNAECVWKAVDDNSDSFWSGFYVTFLGCLAVGAVRFAVDAAKLTRAVDQSKAVMQGGH